MVDDKLILVLDYEAAVALHCLVQDYNKEVNGIDRELCTVEKELYAFMVRYEGPFHPPGTDLLGKASWYVRAWRWLRETCPHCGAQLTWHGIPAPVWDMADSVYGECSQHGVVRT